MLKTNDVIKIKHGINIKYINEDKIAFITDNKKYNIEGEKVKHYILPIMNCLNYPSLLGELYKIIKDYNYETSEHGFLEIIEKLITYGFIVKIDENYLSNKYTDFESGFENDLIVNEKVKKRLDNKNILILNFLDTKHINSIVSQLSRFPFEEITLIDFYDNNNEGYNLNIENNNKVKIQYRFIHEFVSVQELESYRDCDFIISLLSWNDEKIRTKINKNSIELNIPWLNCIVNDRYMEVGPLIQYRSSPCYHCYKLMNVNDNKDNVKTISKNGDVLLKDINIYIALDLIIEDTLRYFLYNILRKTPITFGNIILFKGNELVYSQDDVLIVPNCDICGY